MKKKRKDEEEGYRRRKDGMVERYIPRAGTARKTDFKKNAADDQLVTCELASARIEADVNRVFEVGRTGNDGFVIFFFVLFPRGFGLFLSFLLFRFTR